MPDKGIQIPYGPSPPPELMPQRDIWLQALTEVLPSEGEVKLSSLRLLPLMFPKERGIKGRLTPAAAT